MILYFSGTGNSAYIAKKIAARLSDDTINLFDKLKNNDNTPLHSETPWVIVAPTYAWQIPEIVQNWLLKTRLKGNRSIYFVMTCGDSIGAAPLYLQKLCQKKSLLYKGTAKIVMPENYIAMFKAPDEKKCKQIIKKAEEPVKIFCEAVTAGKSLKEAKINPIGRLLSGPVNAGFNRFYIKSDKFYVKDSCISCGKCESLCPLNNISMYNGQPIWGDDCTHCMSCICKCPVEAIEYGKRSYGKRRYTCPQ